MQPGSEGNAQSSLIFPRQRLRKVRRGGPVLSDWERLKNLLVPPGAAVFIYQVVEELTEL